MSLIVEHSGDGTGCLAQDIGLDDDKGDACRSQVLLSSAVDEVILGNVDRTREDVARHVGNHAHGHIGILAQLGAEDGVVGSDVEVVKVGRHVVELGIVHILVVLAAGHDLDVAKELGLLDGLVGPSTRINIAGFSFQEVVRHHAELQAGTAAQEEHLITLGDVEKFLEQGLSLVHDSLELLAAMGNLEHRKAGTGKITNCINRMVNSVLTHD